MNEHIHLWGQIYGRNATKIWRQVSVIYDKIPPRARFISGLFICPIDAVNKSPLIKIYTRDYFARED